MNNEKQLPKVKGGYMSFTVDREEAVALKIAIKNLLGKEPQEVKSLCSDSGTPLSSLLRVTSTYLEAMHNVGWCSTCEEGGDCSWRREKDTLNSLIDLVGSVEGKLST